VKFYIDLNPLNEYSTYGPCAVQGALRMAPLALARRRAVQPWDVTATVQTGVFLLEVEALASEALLGAFAPATSRVAPTVAHLSVSS
jgi:hypothetical protein